MGAGATPGSVEAGAPGAGGALLQRRIEFHLARKPFSSFPSTSNFKLETLNPSTSSRSLPPSSSNKQSDPSDLLEAALDPDLSFRIPFRRIGAGLENLGNTCFLNSVLQCLTYTEPLVAYLQSGKHHNTCHIAGFCALCAIQKHVSRALQSTGRILAPKDLVSNLRCISRNFRNARQEDAHEYMIHLLQSMHKCCLPMGVPAESPSAYEKSLVHKIFGGRLRSQVKCLQCSYCSNTFDPFLDLSLEIVKADSLYKALKHFTAAEQLDGGERQYKCERCKQKVKALKQLTVYRAPYVLTIHLKRFRSHLAGQKIDKKVQFGSTLDLKPFVSGAYEGDLMYTLYGVLVHAGWSTHSGHYYCFVRTSSGLWYSLDDNRVVQVSEKSVLEQKAYMLFYVRDRKNFAPKKGGDVVEKEKLITTMRNASSSCSIPGVKASLNGWAINNSGEAISSGLPVKNCEHTGTPEVLVQQNASTFVSVNTTTSKKELNQKANRSISSQTSMLISQNQFLLKSDLDGRMFSTTKYTNGTDARNSAKGTALIASFDSDSEFKTCESSLLVSAAKPSVANCPSSVVIDEENRSSHMIGTAADTKFSDALPSVGKDGKSEKIGPSESIIQLNNESGICKEGASGSMFDTHPILSQSRSKLPRKNGSFPTKSHDSTLSRRLRKKILKSRIAWTHLSTKMLYGASLSLRKRTKCKRMKQRKKNIQEHLLIEDLSTDVGPSMSDRVSGSVGSSMDSCSREGEKDAAKDRSTSSDTVLLSGQLPRGSASSSLVAKDTNAGDFSSRKRNCQMQNGAMSPVTGGLKETTVAHWEEILPPSKIVESYTVNSCSIGYVPDEWDEEYDRGKRKKVRGSRNTFGRQNPFQEIATKRAKPKATTQGHKLV